jgi:hypothetical protein
MPLSYLNPSSDPDLLEQQARASNAMYRDEVRYRADLLRRLGFTADQALHRALVNMEEEFGDKGPLKAGEIRKLIKACYG